MPDLSAWRTILGETPPQDIEFMQSLALRYPGEIAVEIGALVGSTTVALALAGMQVYTVDTFEVEPHLAQGGWLEPSRKLLEKNLENCGVEATIIEKDSTEAGQAWNLGPVRLFVHDGRHECEKVVADLEAWLPHIITPGGLVALHDYNNPYVQVARAAREVFGRAADQIHWLTGLYKL